MSRNSKVYQFIFNQLQKKKKSCFWAISDVKFEWGFGEKMGFSNLLLFQQAKKLEKNNRSNEGKWMESIKQRTKDLFQFASALTCYDLS